MAAFLTATATITTSPSVVVAADPDFDRTVVLSPDCDAAVAGFTASSGVRLRQALGGTPYQPTSFTLPAGQELHAWTTSGSCALGVLVTK